MKDNHTAAFFPLLPGKTRAWKDLADELMRSKRDEYKESLKRMGIDHEFVCIQHTPQGDFVVVSDDGKDVSKWAEKLLASKHPFDQWLMKKFEEIHGFKATDPPPPPPELYFDTCAA